MLQIIDEMPEVARLLVLEMDKIRRPHSDLISKSAAKKEYGHSWVENQIKRGLKVIYHGNRKMVSRADLERMKAKENAVARITTANA